MADSLGATREITQVEAEAISTFINDATGRGPLGGFERSSLALSTVFFAPRYVASRFALLAGHPFYKGTARTRGLIAKEYARYLMGMGTVYFLASMAGGEVGDDPTSSDFGKIKFGDTRIDPLSGLSQVAVLVSKIFAGKTTSPITGISKDIRGPEAPFGASNSFELVANFLRSKLSPMAGTAVNFAVGKDLSGQPVTAQGAVAQLVTPLSIRDIYQAVQSEGVPAGSALGLVSLLGAGMQTFKASAQQQASLLYRATSAHPVRKSSETAEKFAERKAAHERAVAEAISALKRIGVTADADLAEQLLRDEVKKRGGSYESVYHHIGALRRVLKEVE
jgi:hypothetical protein